MAEPLMRAIFTAREGKSPVVMDDAADAALVGLATESADRIGLPESPTDLAARVRESDAIEAAARRGWGASSGT